MLIPMMLSCFGWFAINSGEQPGTGNDDIQPRAGSDNEAHADASSGEAAAAMMASNPSACISHEATRSLPATDASGMHFSAKQIRLYLTHTNLACFRLLRMRSFAHTLHCTPRFFAFSRFALTFCDHTL